MRKLFILILVLLLAVNLAAQVKLGGTAKVGGAAKVGVTPAGSALNAKVGSLAEPVSTGNQVITGVGFQTKVVLFWSTASASDGTTIHAIASFGVGVSSSNRRAVGFRSDDNQATSVNTSINQSTTCVYFVAGSSKADFVSHDADGFTLNWTAVDGDSRIINYLALGGSSLTNATTGTIAAKTTTGNQAYTGVGFQPDVLLTFAGKWSSDALDAATNGAFTFGFATSSTERAAIAERSKNGVNPQIAKHRQSTSKVAISLTDAGVFTEADFVSFDADGFTLNYTTAGGSADVIYYLALKGPTARKVGSFNQATSTGNQGVTGAGFQPKALILASANDTSANNDVTGDNGQVSFGIATSSTERAAIWVGDVNNTSPTQTDRNMDRTKAIKLFSPGTPTLNAAADFVSFDGDGFTLNWTTADGTARQVIYLALG